jgi:hypothetical protein
VLIKMILRGAPDERPQVSKLDAICRDRVFSV